MTRPLYVVAALLLTASAHAEPPKKAQPVDQTKPEAVLDAVFEAARTSDTTHLASLCDPKGENDGDTKRICELTTKHPKWAEFKTWFEKGIRVSPVARIRGERAKLNFLFGPDGKKPEEMNLIQREGRWYLSSF